MCEGGSHTYPVAPSHGFQYQATAKHTEPHLGISGMGWEPVLGGLSTTAGNLSLSHQRRHNWAGNMTLYVNIHWHTHPSCVQCSSEPRLRSPAFRPNNDIHSCGKVAVHRWTWVLMVKCVYLASNLLQMLFLCLEFLLPLLLLYCPHPLRSGLSISLLGDFPKHARQSDGSSSVPTGTMYTFLIELTLPACFPHHPVGSLRTGTILSPNQYS